MNFLSPPSTPSASVPRLAQGLSSGRRVLGTPALRSTLCPELVEGSGALNTALKDRAWRLRMGQGIFR